MRPATSLLLVTLASILCPAGLSLAQAPAPTSRIAMKLAVDASEAPRRILRTRMTIPVEPGELALHYPKWLPGEHGPTGPITDVAGLAIRAGGVLLPWRRDAEEMHTFRCEVPAGVSSIEVSFDFLSPPPAQAGFTSGASATANLAVLNWNQLVLYPAAPQSEIEVQPALELPEGWDYGSALETKARSGATVEFAPVSLERLVDSPVLLGRHFRTVALGPAEAPRHYLHIAADSEAALALPEATRLGLDRLVAETGPLFGARHYGAYHFLLALSDHIAHFGLEHHESSDNRLAERTLIDEDLLKLRIGLLTHEFAHSWCGKHRRPADLIRRDFQEPIRSNLLWVYEGLDSYLGVVLAVRSGLWTPEQFRDQLAGMADWASHQQGRTWRSLEDTAVAARLLYRARPDWESWRRSVDFYDEGVLLWLEIDARLRVQTAGARSLDDFCRRFFGGAGGSPTVVPYTFEEIVQALSDVAPYDWKHLLTRRVFQPVASEELEQLALAGWKLVYADERTEIQTLREKVSDVFDLTPSIGLTVDENGAVIDVIPTGPADRAGIGPGMKLVAVEGLRFSEDRLRDALAASSSRGGIELLIENADWFRSYRIDYRDGERYPRLERDSTQPDVLSQILQPRAPVR